MAMPKIAIVAALEREVWPLVRHWKTCWIDHDGRKIKLFENGNASLICGGIGPEAARRATEAIVQHTSPGRVLSVGFAGALDPSIAVGEVLEARIVVNAGDGSRTDTGAGMGTLVSVRSVSGPEQKRKLHTAYDAIAVDMEAAAVAQGAATRGIPFAALKAISDAPHFHMPPVGKFVSQNGGFRSGAFTLYVAVRPWLWRSTVTLARNSAKAGRALCAALEKQLSSRAGDRSVSETGT